MDNESSLVSKPNKVNQSVLKEYTDSEPVFDTRYQSYSRFYIFDIVNADICDELINNNHPEINNSKRSVIRISNIYLSKVCIVGNIVGIYEAEKYYRLKVDDSTACINVVLWKNSVFNENCLNLSRSHLNIQSEYNEIYNILASIQSRIKENSINNTIMYEPKQGDLVLVRANVRCYKQRIELSAVSCVRIQNSSEELIHLVLPSCLANKIYNISAPSLEEYETNKANTENSKCIEKCETNKPNNQVKDKENFLNFVHKKLIQMSSSNILDSSRKVDEFSNESCDSYSLYNYLRNNCPNEFKFVTYKQVLEALKELELRGLAYSCEDEFHYLPMA